MKLLDYTVGTWIKTAAAETTGSWLVSTALLLTDSIKCDMPMFGGKNILPV
jgi:hypothetical protein